MEQTIYLVQIPVIKHELALIGKTVTNRLEALNINGQIATEETVKFLKALRADLNKELTEYETQRKAIKEGINNPYNEFESVYKTEVSEKYKTAIDTLKDQIASVEDRIKSEKKEAVKSYFVELCMSEDIDFVDFTKVGLEINLSTTEKAYKEKCNEFIQKTIDDLALIETQEHKAEILAEFKQSLNASKAIKEIQDRKKREQEEKERIYFAEQNRRKSIILAHTMVFNGMTNAHEYDNDIYIISDFIEKSTKEEFASKIVEIEEAIKSKKQAAIKKIEQAEQFTNNVAQEETQQPIITPQPTAPLQAPTVEVKEEIVKAKFEVEAPMAKLRLLGQYMKDNGIIYSNIK